MKSEKLNELSKRASHIYNNLEAYDVELIEQMSNYICSFVDAFETGEINQVYKRGLIPTFKYKYQTNFEIDITDIERLITLGLFQFKFKSEIYLPEGEVHYMVVSNKLYKLYPEEATSLAFIHLTKEGTQIFGMPEDKFNANVESYYRNQISYFQSIKYNEIGEQNKS